MSMELDHAKVDWIKNLKEMSQEQSTAKQAAEIIAQADEETRCIFAESLSQKAAGSEISVLESLLTDLEESVRYNACETLGKVSEWSTLQSLCRIAENDRAYLVRGRAVISIAEIEMRRNCRERDEVLRFLHDIMQKDTAKWVGYCCNAALYLIGETKWLSELLKGLVHKSFRYRMMAIESIEKVLETRAIGRQEAQQIQFALQNAATKEKIDWVEDRLKEDCEKLANLAQ